jgi:N-acetylneuraminic acid mutarotase
MKPLRFFCTLFTAALLSGCKVQITVPEGGRVETMSGAYVCESGETCVIDVVDIFFDEVFKAKPADGFKFTAWRQKDFAFCGGSNAPCALSTALFPGTPLMALLESDHVFPLEPVFGKPNSWTDKADVQYLSAGSSGCAIGGKLYAVGLGYVLGSNMQDKVEEYDPESDTWTSKANMPGIRNWGTAIAARGKCYVIGGGAGGGRPATSTVEEYDPATDSWRSRAPMPENRALLGAAVVGGKIYVIGGGGGSISHDIIPSAAVLIYDPVKNKWSSGADMPTPRIKVGVAAIDGIIYAVGGSNNNIGLAHTSIVERYDPKKDKWTKGTSLPVKRSYLSTIVVDGKLYALGGATGEAGNGTATVYRYNPQTDQWAKRANMSTPRWAFASAALNGQIYVVAGRTLLESGDLTSTEEYTP